jgi:hypothetical protein
MKLRYRKMRDGNRRVDQRDKLRTWKVVTVFAMALSTLTGCAPYGCGRGYSTPVDAARDLAAFNQVLRSNPAFKGLTATAVHGHRIAVTESNSLTSDNPDDPVNFKAKYNLQGGTGDKLRAAWLSTFSRLYPREFNRNVVEIEIYNGQGRVTTVISVPQCVLP